MAALYPISLIIIVLTIFSIALLNISYGQANQSSQIYESSDVGIKFQYPSEWGKVTEKNSEGGGCHNKPLCVLTFEGSNASYRFGFVLGKFPKVDCNCNSLTDFVKYMYKQQLQYKDFSFINDNKTIIGKNYSGWQYEISFLNEDNVPVIGLNVMGRNNDNYYSISIMFQNETRSILLPEFRRFINSIEFLPIQNEIANRPSFMNLNETKDSIPEKSIDNNPSGLQILSHNSFTDSIGYFHVVGEIKNNYPSTATFVKIIGTFYDVNNIVVGTDFTYANPSDITSGQKAPFELLLMSASVPISQIDHYNLQVTSQ
jgi:hypothetical protein